MTAGSALAGTPEARHILAVGGLGARHVAKGGRLGGLSHELSLGLAPEGYQHSGAPDEGRAKVVLAPARR